MIFAPATAELIVGQSDVFLKIVEQRANQKQLAKEAEAISGKSHNSRGPITSDSLRSSAPIRAVSSIGGNIHSTEISVNVYFIIKVFEFLFLPCNVRIFSFLKPLKPLII